jgi:ribosomal protein S18 acetylase RimI-like enzyme
MAISTRVSDVAIPLDATPPCKILEWDTQFWGFTIGTVVGDSLTPERVRSIDMWARQHNVRCVYLLARSTDTITQELAGAALFDLVDTRRTFECPVNRGLGPAAVRTDVRIRLSQPDDVPVLEQIARSSFTSSRFYFDTHFPRVRCGDLYAQWIRQDCQTKACAVFVADDEREVLGFVSCRAGSDERDGQIELIAVRAAARGHGVGEAFVMRALEYFACCDKPMVQVVTQARNEAAMRLYTRCGFKASDTHLRYHKWYSAG